MLTFVNRRFFFGFVLGFVVLFAIGSVAGAAEGESGYGEMRHRCRGIIADGLESEDMRVRVSAVRAVGEFLGTDHEFDNRRPQEALKSALGDPSLKVAYAAAQFLPDNDRAKQVIARYVKHLADKGDIRSRLERIRLLKLDKKLEYVKKKALFAKNATIRADAIRTLGVLGGTKAVTTVMETYSDENKTVQAASRGALHTMGFRFHRDGRDGLTNMSQYAHSKSTTAKFWCLTEIGRMLKRCVETEQRPAEMIRYPLFAALQLLLRDPEPEIRQEAARTLREKTLDVGRLIPTLIEQVKNEEEIAVKVTCAGVLLGHLDRPQLRRAEEKYGKLRFRLYTEPVHNLLSEMGRIAKRRGEGQAVVGHLLLAFGYSDDKAVQDVVHKFGLTQNSLIFAGRVMVGRGLVEEYRIAYLGTVKKRFDEQTMNPEAIHNGFDLVLVVPWRRVFIENKVRQILFGTALRKKRTLRTLWQSLWQYLNSEERGQKVKGIVKYLENRRKQKGETVE